MNFWALDEIALEDLAHFFDDVSEDERAVFKQDVTDTETLRAWQTSRTDHWEAAVDNGGKLVGLLGVKPQRGWSAHVGQVVLMIRPTLRSRGLGRELARAAVAVAQQRGLAKIVVELLDEQEAATNMFLSLGFRTEGQLRSHVRARDGRVHDLVLLGYDIDPIWGDGEPPDR